jgi:hypothetical protein
VGPADIDAISNGWVEEVLFILVVAIQSRLSVLVIVRSRWKSLGPTRGTPVLSAAEPKMEALPRQ